MNPDLADGCNISARLRELAVRQPHQRAVVRPVGRDAAGRATYAHLTFAQLDRDADRLARGLTQLGLVRGQRVSLFVRPGLEFFALTFALFRLGTVPVLIDPGMGRRGLIRCLGQVEPEALIGPPLVQLISRFFPRALRSVRQRITTESRRPWGGTPLPELYVDQPEPFPVVPTAPDELAAILFTTGSTGPAKGVEYTHAMFDRQCDLIHEIYGLGPGDVDLPTFPLFGLFSVALGMTAVIPDMDPTRPGQVDPRRILEPLEDQGCTCAFGSPALWKRVAGYCGERFIKLPALRKVLIAGAPVPSELHRRLLAVLPTGAETHTPYGATESLPVCDLTGAEVLAETAALTAQGQGVCVGRPVPGVEVAVIQLTDEPLPEWRDELRLPPGRIGEIAARGDHVTRSYFRLDRANELHKIHTDGHPWHRLGDVGYFDETGRLWYCGRKAHRVETPAGPLFTVCAEAIFNQDPRVRRSALVGVGERPNQTPVIVIEAEELPSGKIEREKLRTELLRRGAEHELTRGIELLLFHPAFPVDIRHNAKIGREELARWAGGQLKT